MTSMPLPIPSTADEDLVIAAIRALAVHGPASPDRLGAVIGVDTDSFEFDALIDELTLQRDRVVWLPDDVLVDLVGLLSGWTLTHRLSRAEADGGYLDVVPNLLPLAELAEDSLPLAAGGRAEIVVDREEDDVFVERLRGPDTWLGGAKVGDLVGLALVDGEIVVSAPVGEADLADIDQVGAALWDAAARAIEVCEDDGDERIVDVHEVLAGALAFGHIAAPVLPPLGETIERTGLACLGGMVALEAEAFDDDPTDLEDAVARTLFGLDDVGVAHLTLLRGLHEQVAEDVELSPEVLELALAGLADPNVVEAFAVQTEVDLAAARLAELALPSARGSAESGARFLRSLRAERDGNAIQAERELQSALAADPSFRPALLDAAWYAEDRGDINGALSLLRRAEVDDGDEQAVRLTSVLVRQRPTRGVGRNDPCPCGSGRKYKRCCAGRLTAPLADRASWLVEKLLVFVRRPANRERMEEIAHARHGSGAEALVAALGDPLLIDLAVFDLGLLDEFLAQRGPLLPEDELLLAESWRTTQRGLYRVVKANDDRVTLEPPAGGSTTTAVAPLGTPELEPGELVLCRLVSDGSQPMLFYAGLRLGALPRPDVEAALAGDDGPAALATALAPRPPIIRNTEGEPSVLCRLRYVTDDPHATRAALRTLGLDEVHEDHYVEWIEVDGQPYQRGSIVLSDSELEIATNGEARMDRLRAQVEATVPGLRPVAEHRTPALVAMDDWRRFAIPDQPHEPPAEARAALAAFLREEEERWCDTSVPAIGGRTPRQAIGDPAGRRDVEALLDAMGTSVDGFDAGRIRSLLGLA